MRVLTPRVRYNGDVSPITWLESVWAIVLAPLTITALGITVLLSIPYFAIYPDHHPHAYDRGTSKQRETIRRYRKLVSRVPFWRRCGHAFQLFLQRSPGRTQWVIRQLPDEEVARLKQMGIE